MSAPQLHFWNWDTPVLTKAVVELTREWKGGELDLSQTIVLVPTSETVRRLREALAVTAAEKNGAVVAPFIWHPESALMHDVDRTTLLTPLQEQLLWRSVLEGIQMVDYEALFPTEPAAAKETWAAGVAEMLVKLRSAVGAGGMSLAEVGKKLSIAREVERWEELASLERLYLAQAQELGLRDPHQVKLERAKEPSLPKRVQRLCVFALADATPLLKQWLLHAVEKVRVDIYVQAPVGHAQAFDETGAPILEAWREVAGKEIRLHENQLHLVADPQQQARQAIALLRQSAEEEKPTALGLADPLLAPQFDGALSNEGVRVFDPAGRKASRHALLEVLRLWQRLAQTHTFRSLSVFLRLDDVLRVVAEKAVLSTRDFLDTLDEFYAERLPPTLEEAVTLSTLPLPGRMISNEEAPGVETAGQKRQREKSEALQKLNTALRDIAARLEAWETAEPAAALRGLLEWIYGERQFATEKEDDRGYTFLFGEVARLAQEAKDAVEKLKTQATAGALTQTVVRTLEETQLPDTRGEIDLVLQGWLELLWEPAESLVVCGFNDESVPGKIAPDPFLPDNVRQELGLACQASRRARDAYLLCALAAQRESLGELHLVIGQTNDEGDALRPSRLLFGCDDQTLPGRVKHLFPDKPPPPAEPQPPRTVGWQLEPWRVKQGLTSVNVSLLTSYLNCPLRCALQKFLKMEPVDASQREMSMGDFGVLVHEVLAAFGREEGLRDSRSEKDIRQYFDMALDRIVSQRWGARPLLSTLLQVEAARQRLTHAAAVQAQLRSEGWRIKEVEFDITVEDGLKLADVPFRGRLDRVDEHEQTHVLRVWDYKTQSTPQAPVKAHAASLSAEALEEGSQDWKSFELDGKARVWINLQLPLYVWALRALHPEAPGIEAGYIHLPKAVKDFKSEIWKELDAALVESAHGCAEEVVRRMKAGEFWPPAEKPKYDSFEELLLGDPYAAVLESAKWKEESAA